MRMKIFISLSLSWRMHCFRQLRTTINNCDENLNSQGFCAMSDGRWSIRNPLKHAKCLKSVRLNRAKRQVYAALIFNRPIKSLGASLVRVRVCECVFVYFQSSENHKMKLGNVLMFTCESVTIAWQRRIVIIRLNLRALLLLAWNH